MFGYGYFLLNPILYPVFYQYFFPWATSGEKVSAIILCDMCYIIYTGNRQIKLALFLMPGCSFSNTTPTPCHCLIPEACFPTRVELDAFTLCVIANSSLLFYFIGIKNPPYPYDIVLTDVPENSDYVEYMLPFILPVTTSRAKADRKASSRRAEHEFGNDQGLMIRMPVRTLSAETQTDGDPHSPRP